MIITVLFKTPDVLDYVLDDMGLEHEEAQAVREKLSKWIKWDECVTIEFDTAKMTATVKEA